MSTATIELVHDGSVFPLTYLDYPRSDHPGRFDGGVYYGNGEFCVRSAVHLANCQHEPSTPRPSEHGNIAHISGSHIFGGLVNNIHFGHFITESLVRLWAIDSLNETFKSVVFYKFSTNHEVPNFVFDTIDLIAPGANISILEGPASFELLAVPQELKSGSYIYGHSAVRKMCRGLLSRLERRNGLEKVYVSRSRLGAGNGGLIYEELIDEYMQAEGYTVLYPEEMPIRDQLEIYSSAEKLVFADGSAVHLYALVAQPHQSVFVIWRRGKYSIFDWQIKTFGGPSVQGEACIEELWVPEKEPSPSYGKSVLNLGQLSSQLYDGGFISQSKWCGPSRDEIKKRLEDIIKETGLPYIQIAVPT